MQNRHAVCVYFCAAFPTLVVPAASVHCGDDAVAAVVILGGGVAAIT